MISNKPLTTDLLPFACTQSLYIIRDVLRQLEVAHGRNVLHGDVGVSNILVDAHLPEGVELGE